MKTNTVHVAIIHSDHHSHGKQLAHQHLQYSLSIIVEKNKPLKFQYSTSNLRSTDPKVGIGMAFTYADVTTGDWNDISTLPNLSDAKDLTTTDLTDKNGKVYTLYNFVIDVPSDRNKCRLILFEGAINKKTLLHNGEIHYPDDENP